MLLRYDMPRFRRLLLHTAATPLLMLILLAAA